MARKLAVLNIVGLSSSLLPHAPRIAALGTATPLLPVLPAVTCPVQASMLTGLPVAQHGIVGNGWFNADLQEVHFWKQSNRLVHGEKLWETARRIDPSCTCANLFWWFNMYSSVDFAVTPRPQYRADGRKIPDLHTHPADLRDTLQARLGPFPLFHFWGPASDLRSSRWIADAAMHVVRSHDPTLTLIYLPHLDYGLQKLGPDHLDIPRHVANIDAIAGDLIDFFHRRDTRVIAVSEYGIEAVRHPIAVNRQLRDAGLLAVREEGGRELLDPGASRAFAVVDHQVAHIHHHQDITLPPIPGTTATTIDHPRAGRTVLVADPGHWFTYDWWPADRPDRAPDYARTVDIHRKPGYDPRELFCDAGRATIAWKLLKKKLGFRQLMDVIPLDATRVRGSHGRVDVPDPLRPLLIGADTGPAPLPCTTVRDVILEAALGDAPPPAAAGP